MTSIAKTARVALAVALLALATAGAASADAFHPDPFVSTGAPADVYRPATHVNPGAIRAWDYARPAGSSWSATGIARFHPNAGGCMRGCVI